MGKSNGQRSRMKEKFSKGWAQMDRPTTEERTAPDLAASLQSAVSAAWQKGWQPADLARVVSRQLTNRHVRLTRDAVAARLRAT